MNFAVRSLMPPGIAGVVEIDLLLLLAAGEHHLIRIHHDDVVAVVHVGREGGLVLAAQAQRDQRREAADDEALGIDHHPLLLDVGRLGRISLAKHEDSGSVTKKRPPNREPPLAAFIGGRRMPVNADPAETSSKT